MAFIQFSSVTQPCLTLCNPMDWGTSCFPVHHQLPELAQIHVHRVGDSTQPSHPLSSPSSPAFNLSQHQGLFQWVSSSHQVPKYWSINFSISPSNDYSELISFRIDWFGLLAVQGTSQSSPVSRVFSNTTVQRHQFISAQLFLWSTSHIHTWFGKTIALTRRTFLGEAMSLLFGMLSRFVANFFQGTSVFLSLNTTFYVLKKPQWGKRKWEGK